MEFREDCFGGGGLVAEEGLSKSQAGEMLCWVGPPGLGVTLPVALSGPPKEQPWAGRN